MRERARAREKEGKKEDSMLQLSTATITKLELPDGRSIKVETKSNYTVQ